MPRNESGVSLASGIYEEIPEDVEVRSAKSNKHTSHVYENPMDLIMECSNRFSNHLLYRLEDILKGKSP